MQKLKNVLYYVGWSIFWIAALLFAGAFLVETGMIRFFLPFIFLAGIAYAAYAMLKTKPAPSTEEKQSPTPDTKSDAGTVSKN